MDNSQMIAGRFLKIQRGKKLYTRVQFHIKAGGVVLICTALRITKITAKYAEAVTLGKSGSVYLQNGKRKDCIDFCTFKFI